MGSLFWSTELAEDPSCKICGSAMETGLGCMHACMRWYEGEESMVPASTAGRQGWGRHSLVCKAAGVG